jgi:hypothetical protein
MYVNSKMIPVETVAGTREGGMKERGGGVELKNDVFDTL